MEIQTIRGTLSIDFTHKERIYNLLITFLRDSYVDWQVSQDYVPLYSRFGLYLPYGAHTVKLMINEAITELKL